MWHYREKILLEDEGLRRLALRDGAITVHDLALDEATTIDEVVVRLGAASAMLAAGAQRLAPENTAGSAGILPTEIEIAESTLEATISEVNLNRALSARAPEGGPLREIHVMVLSGKLRVTAQVSLAMLHVPITLDALPKVEGGSRIRLEFQAARMGISLPQTVVDVLEQLVHERVLRFDLSKLPFPVHIDEVRCEPGRILCTARGRFSLRHAAAPPAAAPFGLSPSTRNLEPPEEREFHVKL